MLVKKSVENKLLKLIQFQSGEVVTEFILNKKKILVGSAPSCDLVIEHPSISHYHAILILDENGGKVIDLESSNGLYVNGERIKNCFFSEGDIIKFGPVEFHTHEEFIEGKKETSYLEDQDSSVKRIDELSILEKPQELPPVEGLVVIDGEYCDIVFDESNFSPIDDIPAHQTINKDFIDYEELEKEQVEIFRHNENKAVEVTIMSMGTILSVNYFRIANGTYFASSDLANKKTVQIYNLESDDIIPFFKISDGEVIITPLPEFKGRNISNGTNITTPTAISNNEVFSFDYRTIQVMIKIVEAPPSIRLAPFFGRDVAFQKQTAKIFSAVMGIMLLLLFVDISIQEPKRKKIAVIYRKAVKSDKSMDKSSEDVNKKNVDKGVKKKQQDNEKPKFAKKMDQPKKQNRQEVKQPQKRAEAKSSPTKAVKKPKMKAYEFKSTKSFSSMFSTKNNVTKTNVQNVKSNSANGFETAKTQNTKGLKSTQSVNMGSLGKDFKGKFNSSSGAYGLASKSGIDTSYVDTKTVVLGSMDPELLRKILREYLPQFRHCYQKELQVNDGLKGIIDLDFRIGKSGAVSKVNIKVKNAKFSSQGISCMSGVLKLIPFPKPKGGGVVDVRQPLSFFSETEKMN